MLIRNSIKYSPSTPTPPIYDVLVHNDTELTAALDAYGVLGGKTIALAHDGVFSVDRQFTQTPLAPLYLIGLTAYTRPNLPDIILRGCSNIHFTYIDHGRDVTSGSCVRVWNSSFALNCSWDDCAYYGQSFDPFGDYVSGTPTTRQGMSSSGTAYVENLTFTRNSFRYLENSLKVNAWRGVNNRSLNFHEYIWEDCDHCAWAEANPPHGSTFIGNIYKDRVGRSTDAGNPHGDAIQLAINGETASARLRGIRIIGNRLLNTGRGTFQGILLDDNGGLYRGFEIAHNRGFNLVGDSQALYLTRGAGNYMFNNASVHLDPEDAAATETCTFNIQGVLGENKNLLSSSAAEVLSVTGPKDVPNTNVSLTKTRAAYGAVFNGPFDVTNTLEEATEAFKYKPGHPLAYLNDVFDYSTGEVDKTLEPTWVGFTDITGQIAGSTVESEWAQALGGLDTHNVSITGGRYKTATDENGSDATAYTTSAGSYPKGTFYKIEVVNSADSSTVSTATLDLNGYSQTFSSTTASATAFANVTNGGTARSIISPVPADTGITKFAVAVKFRRRDTVAGANVLASNTASTLRLNVNTAAQYRMQLGGSGIARPTISVAMQTAAPEVHILTFDFAQAAIADGCKWSINGVPQTVSGAWTAGSILSMATVLNQLGVFGQGDGGGIILNGDVEYLWIDYGDNSYTLVDTVADYNKFSADNIGPDGSGPTSAQPEYYFTGSAGAADGSVANTWNATAGLVNRGKKAAALVKQAGTYTDV